MGEVPKREFVSPPNEVHRALQQDVLGEDGDFDAWARCRIESGFSTSLSG